MLQREFVEQVIYGWSASRRYLQDDPIRPDVWIEFATHPGERQRLLVEPMSDVRPSEIYPGLVKALKEKDVLKEAGVLEDADALKYAGTLKDVDTFTDSLIAYNQSTLAIDLTMKQMVQLLLPRTHAWVSTIGALKKKRLSSKNKNADINAINGNIGDKSEEEEIREKFKILHIDRGYAVPIKDVLVRDLKALYEGRMPAFYDSRLLGMLRIIGLIQYAEKACQSKEGNSPSTQCQETTLTELQRLVKEGRGGWSGAQGKRDGFLETLAEVISIGWQEGFDNLLPGFPQASDDPEQKEDGISSKQNENRFVCPKKGSIFAVNCNRRATTAAHRSTLTIKADAARLLFAIRCHHICWAVMDSGIDARHPAFQDWPLLPGSAPLDPNHRQLFESPLKNTRVIETYDFTEIRNLLFNLSQIDCREIEGKSEESIAYNLKEMGVHGEYVKTIQKRPGVVKEIQSRLARGRDIDWDILRPILRVEHDEGYLPPNNPHGTHVAGVLGANWPITVPEGVAFPPDDQGVFGVCPDIRLIDLRVCMEDGTSDEFIITSALQFIRYLNTRRDFMAVHGANLSLSLKHDVANFACGRTPVCQEAERLVHSGVVVVAAAGNNGYNRFRTTGDDYYEGYCSISISDPGNAEGVITVGATHRTDPHAYGVSYFSSRGPTGDGRCKPDLVAPGEKICGPVPNDGYASLDGTSMAAPHVSGAAALLMARNLEMVGEPQRIKRIFCETATDLGRERYFQGHGLVDALRALQSL